MKYVTRFAALVILVVLSCTHTSAAEPEEIMLWPGKAPGETGAIGPEREIESKPGTKPVIRLTDVSQPMLTVYRPDNPADTGTCVIVAPGGGYNILAYDLEGTEICEWLNTIGVTAVLLKYRVPRRDKDQPHEIPLKDAQRAVRIVRSQAKELGISAERIGLLGFSAGGNLTVMTGTSFRSPSYEPIDNADKESSRPDFLIPIYPAYLVDRDDDTKLDDRIKVDSDTPPTFMAITQDDADRAIGTAHFFIALKRAKVPCELHIYHKGGHGYGLRPSEFPVTSWPRRCEQWMISMGYLK